MNDAASMTCERASPFCDAFGGVIPHGVYNFTDRHPVEPDHESNIAV